MKTKTLLLLTALAAISSCKTKVTEGAPAPANRSVVTEEATKITTNTTWKVGEKHLLKGFVYVQSPAVLTIEVDSIVLGDKSSKGSLIVQPGAKLMAEGTPRQTHCFHLRSGERLSSLGGHDVCGSRACRTRQLGLLCDHIFKSARLKTTDGNHQNFCNVFLYHHSPVQHDKSC